MEKIRIGVLGAYRGTSMINYCKAAGNAEVVAICDKWTEGLEKQKQFNKGLNITYYDNFDDFIEHDMDAVVLANYAHQHAPFAIRAMKKGLHVFSEVLPVQNLKEAVELCEAVEETGKVYAYGENYCYMEGPHEMKRLYEAGKIGELEYAECEYLHNCAPFWHSLTYGDPNHWRNNMYATFYCTHSLGPIIHATGLRPVSVTGFEGKLVSRQLLTGQKRGAFGMEMVTLENGAIVKSIHGGLYKNSLWYCMYGDKGKMETARDDAQMDGCNRIYVNADEDGMEKRETYLPVTEGRNDDIVRFGHCGSDYWSMYHFVERIRGNENADIIDVYEALDMGLLGILAYRSILKGGTPVEVPNFRDKTVREQYRNDTACTDPEVAGAHLLPAYSKGNPEIASEVYEMMKAKFEEEFKADTGHVNAAFRQSAKEEK